MKTRTTILLSAMAFLLCAWDFVEDEPFACFADSLHGPLQTVVSFVMMPFIMLHGFSFMIGTGIFVVLVGRRASQEPDRSHAFHPLLVPLLSIIWLALQATPFLCVPAGSGIRPMAWALFVGISGLGLTIYNVVSSVAGLFRGKNKPACVVALLVSLTIVAIPSLSLWAVARIKGFELEP